MIFLSTLENMDVVRSVCFPDDIPRLNRNTAIFIPSISDDDFCPIAHRLSNGHMYLRVRGLNSIYRPKMLKFKAGIKLIMYKDMNYKDHLKDLLLRTEVSNVTYVEGQIKDYNTFINYTDIIKELLGEKILYTPATSISIWNTLLTSDQLVHKNKYILFTPEIIKTNIRVAAAIRGTHWKIKNLYISFLYHLIYHYDTFTSLLRNNNWKVIVTDYKYTFRIDFDTDMTKDELIDKYFFNVRKMNLGKAVDDESINLEKFEQEVIVESYEDEALTNTMRIVDVMKKQKIKDAEVLLDEEVQEVIKDVQEGKILTKNEQRLKDRVDAITEVVEKSIRTNVKIPQRIETVKNKQLKIQDQNLTEVLARLDEIAENILEPDVIDPTKEQFGKFSINKLDEQYEKISKKDRMDIAEAFNNMSIPLYLTNYKEEVNMTNKDNYVKKIQFTFESPDNDGEKHTFTVNVPTLRDGKFLYINGSDKVMIRQKIALPIIRLEEEVVMTSYYNKMFISLTSGNLSKAVAKVKKYIRYIRKKNPQMKLKDYFSFVPAYYTAKHNNDLGPEILEISKLISYLKIDKDNWLDLNNGRMIAKINGEDYETSAHDDLIINKVTGEELTALTLFDRIISKLEPIDSDLYTPWKIIFKQKGSDNIAYSRAKILSLQIPVILIVLHAVGENLLEVLDILKRDYRLEYEITPLGAEVALPKKIYHNDDADRFLFKTFVLDVKYNSISNRHLLHPLTQIDLTGYNSLILKGLVEDNIPSTNTVMYMENFEDLFIDPITKKVMEDCGMPNNYPEALIYANSMLVNYDRTVSEVSLENERMPSNTEIIHGALWKVMADQYKDYSVKRKRGSRTATFSVEKNAIAKLLSVLPNVEESSKINSIQHVDKFLTISNKGISGINNERSYTVRKRKWDKSFYGIMSDVSPYGPKTGVTKHLSVNPNIKDVRGYFNSKKPSETNADELMAVSEALRPYTQKHDSSPRTAMSMMQANHLMGTHGAEPALVTYGMDESMAYLDGDFAKRLKDDATVLVVNERYLKIKYNNIKDDYGNDIIEVFNLDETERNSAKGFYIPNTFKLNSKIKNLKVGSKLSKNMIVAYNSNFYEEYWDEVVFKSGPIVNIAIGNTEYSHEDASLISEFLAKKLETKILKRIAVKIGPRNRIQEARSELGPINAGDVLIKISEDTGSDFLNKTYDLSVLDDYLMKVKKSNYNGVLKDIFIYYKLTESDEVNMDVSIKEFMDRVDNYYNNRYNGFELSKNLPNYEKNRLIEHVTRFTDNGKNKVNGDLVDKGEILIEFFIEVNQNFSTGDKLTIGNTAMKGVCSKILPLDKCPIGEESGKRYDLVLSTFSPLARMIYSTFLVGSLTACMEKLNDNIVKIIESHK